jgi:hypothetical protein
VTRAAQLPRRRADRLAGRLRLRLDSTRVCLACLSIVAFALDDCNRHEIQGRLMQLTVPLWEEGLAEPALAAVREACDRGVPDAEAALADLERHGGRTPVARAIVLCLARQLRRRARIEAELTSRARERLERTLPELN